MPPKQRNIRKKRALEEEEDGEAAGEGEPTAEIEKATLEDLKLLQKLRKRTAGIHSSALAASRADEADFGEENELMEAYVKAQGAQTVVLTEEQHMERYVEQEVAKRLGKQVDDGLQRATSQREREEDALFEVPEELKAQLKNEVSIPGLNTAITEVEVSKEAKLRKIEETEAIKRRLLEQDAGWGGDVGPGDAKAGKVHRASFVPRFGRQLPKVQLPADVDPEELERRRRFVSERTPDPRKLKQQQLQQQRGGGR